MKTNFVLYALLLCSTTMSAQQRPQQNRNGQPPNILEQNVIGRYPGGVYTVWDTSAKQYRQYSPARGYLQNSFLPATQNTSNA